MFTVIGNIQNATKVTGTMSFLLKKYLTSIKVWSVLDSSSEDAHLTEEHCHQQRCPGRVGGGGQQVGDPGGHSEHAGGDEVDKDVLPVAAHQLYLDPHHRVGGLWIAPGGYPGILSSEVAHIDLVASDFVLIQNLSWRHSLQVGGENH